MARQNSHRKKVEKAGAEEQRVRMRSVRGKEAEVAASEVGNLEFYGWKIVETQKAEEPEKDEER